ncbi:hypothetical protein [Pyxidicoccus xibeiensis]|uniref:hypothetical protein n=1 Tax=Pyxidicoccus xibeiensis TaxID=2906759 RepID=UPI0020A6F435|nr:hypothetical protein [Pyxidicoccus xibeiensis]MCP3139279.1 hypothetical protein [Pyxidicoccus xibeiensis]
MFNPANIQMGMTARDRDGERLGTIIAVDAGGFFIGQGGLFTRDCRVAFSDVTDIDRDDVYLREPLARLPGVRPDALGAGHAPRPAPGVALQHDLTGGLGLQPGDLEQARMDSAKFQDHGRYDVGEGEVDASVVAVRQPSMGVEQRAARDEDALPRRDAPRDTDPGTRR